MDELVFCTQCHTPLAAEYYNSTELLHCPSCHVPLKIDVFPALFHGVQAGKAGEPLIDDQASCFYHPQKKAVVPCDQCGRFLCALCDVEFGGKHLCPSCLETGKQKGKIINLEHHRVLYDSTALILAVFPLLFLVTIIFSIMVFFTVLTAPAALYLAIRHWNSPMSIVRRTKVRFILAIALSSMQILAVTIGIVYLISKL
jgi:hypothetical protein